MRIAYLINQYPKVSHTFIRREILALERQGLQIMRISIRGWANDLVDEADLSERKQTRYVLKSGTIAMVSAVLAAIVFRPIQFAHALSLAFRIGFRADRPLPYHLIYLAEACLILRWLRQSDVEHVHAHFGTNSAEVAMLVHALGGPSWSFTVHGPEEFDKPHSIKLSEKIRRSSFVVAISSYGRSQLFRMVESHYWSKIHIVRCGLDKTFFDLAGVRKDRPNPIRFICVGRFCEQKGQLLLLQAAGRLRSKGNNFELVLAGDGEMRKELEGIIKSARIDDTIRITGWIDNSRVRQEILDATALVLPSFAEGIPVAIMEAMALSRPIISTYVGGIPELVIHGENGWLIPAGDFDGLVGAMEQCINLPGAALDRLGLAARQKVSQFHDIDTEVQRLRALFEKQTGKMP